MPDDIRLRFWNYQGLLNVLHGEIKLFREWKLPVDSEDPLGVEDFNQELRC